MEEIRQEDESERGGADEGGGGGSSEEETLLDKKSVITGYILASVIVGEYIKYNLSHIHTYIRQNCLQAS